ncbi:glycogen/starch/alpha-glucan phosphorylase [uncultured Maritimibacter sp.]|jgi:starch phosphorylase|uniref:glycogen/starch/alpha-glucan phosphorylase n=1 Tax=uncultured Maritimibacter sp. TaxID=991866 RepID=UPI000AC5B253|nr:glycogen/starch/alpha-glucan phosphorylase [uncultured Maritimibacter sp.]
MTPLDNLPTPAKKSDPKTLAVEIIERLKHGTGKDPKAAKPHDWLQAVILVVRDRLVDHWIEWKDESRNEKRVYYLSLEFLIGRLMRDAITNLGLEGEINQALANIGVDLDILRELEPDAALGNGGLGRLAACFMESMASVGIPAYGYGIRYQHGLFRQEIRDGWQVELPEMWLSHGNPWEFERRESAYEIGFGGTVEPRGHDKTGVPTFRWKPSERMTAAAYDTPVVGWKGDHVNSLRLWSAQPIDPILLARFNAGDYVGALEESNRAETLTQVLYPQDSHIAGQELRLRQEFFFSSASLQDILRRHGQLFHTFDNLPEKVAIQLNDTHPAIAVAEMMRLLIDNEGYDFARAWELTNGTFAYTNHTLLPEALESWPVALIERLLPRHMQIIYQINAMVLKSARKDGLADEVISRISLIDEGGERRVRMGNLAFMGSHSVNGVSALHSDLMKETVFADLNAVFPGRINNKTNGITPRRWLAQCNPALLRLVQGVVGDVDLMAETEALTGITGMADDAGFQSSFEAIKRRNKEQLARVIQQRMGLRVDPGAIFDIQIKRIHEYKRQLLNLIETVALYDQIRSHPEKDWVPRVKIFAGKAAPSYHTAKLIIKLANDIARVVNNDPIVGDLLKVVFLPNYNVSLAEVLVPAADLSEQISTAGMEASGTGNMKFALNGAVTIGTLDGANVEIKDLVGDENIVIFGLTAQEVSDRRAIGRDPGEIIAASPELAQALRAIKDGAFSADDPSRYADLIGGIESHDWFMVSDDFDSYTAAQRRVDALWSDRATWNRMAILNTANVGWFSSDRTIRQYASDIWGVPTK